MPMRPLGGNPMNQQSQWVHLGDRNCQFCESHQNLVTPRTFNLRNAGKLSSMTSNEGAAGLLQWLFTSSNSSCYLSSTKKYRTDAAALVIVTLTGANYKSSSIARRRIPVVCLWMHRIEIRTWWLKTCRSSKVSNIGSKEDSFLLLRRKSPYL